MARRLAAFQVMHDGWFKMKKGDCARQLTLDMSRIDGRYALLAYKVWTNGKSMKYEIDVKENGKCGKTRVVYNEAAVSNKAAVGVWEAFSTKLARAGNKVRFSVTAGEGTIYFSDVVLWCMRN